MLLCQRHVKKLRWKAVSAGPVCRGSQGKGERFVGLEMCSASNLMLTRRHRGHTDPHCGHILPMPPAVSQSACLPICQLVLSVCLPICQSVSQFVDIFPFRLFVSQPVILSANLPASLSACLLFCLPICQSMRLSGNLTASLSVRIFKFIFNSFSVCLSSYLSYFCRL